jgi:hypothetical protein
MQARLQTNQTILEFPACVWMQLPTDIRQTLEMIGQPVRPSAYQRMAPGGKPTLEYYAKSFLVRLDDRRIIEVMQQLTKEA